MGDITQLLRRGLLDIIFEICCGLGLASNFQKSRKRVHQYLKPTTDFWKILLDLGHASFGVSTVLGEIKTILEMLSPGKGISYMKKQGIRLYS